jgi:hypothetical protein
MVVAKSAIGAAYRKGESTEITLVPSRAADLNSQLDAQTAQVMKYINYIYIYIYLLFLS